MSIILNVFYLSLNPKSPAVIVVAISSIMSQTLSLSSETYFYQYDIILHDLKQLSKNKVKANTK